METFNPSTTRGVAAQNDPARVVQTLRMQEENLKEWMNKYVGYEDAIGFDPPKHPQFSVFVSTTSQKYIDWQYDSLSFLYQGSKSKKFPQNNTRIKNKICKNDDEALQQGKIITMFLYWKEAKRLYSCPMYCR